MLPFVKFNVITVATCTTIPALSDHHWQVLLFMLLNVVFFLDLLILRIWFCLLLSLRCGCLVISEEVLINLSVHFDLLFICYSNAKQSSNASSASTIINWFILRFRFNFNFLLNYNLIL